MLNMTIRGHDLSGVTSVKELAEQTKKQGIHNLQLALGMSFPDMPSGAANLNPGMGAAIKRELAKEDVQVGILSCYINMIHPDLEIREQLLQKFESYLRHARYFGAAMVASEKPSAKLESMACSGAVRDDSRRRSVPCCQMA